MKRLLPVVATAATLLIASCAKNDAGLNTNQWSISGKTIQADKVDVSYGGNYISGVNGDGSSLTASFKTLPTGNLDLNVTTEATANTDVSVRAILGGSLVYNSFPQTNNVMVRFNGSTYTLIMNDIKLVNAADIKDTVVVSCNLVQ
jgi:hypothetical protein